MAFEIGTDGIGGLAVGFDGSGPSHDALAFSAGIARRNGAGLTVVYVIDPGAETLGRLVQRIECLADRRQVGLPLIGQQQRAVAAHEKLQAKPLLETAHLMTDRCLGDAELAGRLGEGEMTRRGLEGTHAIERRQGTLHRENSPHMRISY